MTTIEAIACCDNDCGAADVQCGRAHATRGGKRGALLVHDVGREGAGTLVCGERDGRLGRASELVAAQARQLGISGVGIMLCRDREVLVGNRVVASRSLRLLQDVRAVVEASCRKGRSVGLGVAGQREGLDFLGGLVSLDLGESELCASKGLVVLVDLVNDDLVGEDDVLVVRRLAGVALATLVRVVGEGQVDRVGVASSADDSIAVQGAAVGDDNLAVLGQRDASNLLEVIARPCDSCRAIGVARDILGEGAGDIRTVNLDRGSLGGIRETLGHGIGEDILVGSIRIDVGRHRARNLIRHSIVDIVVSRVLPASGIVSGIVSILDLLLDGRDA